MASGRRKKGFTPYILPILFCGLLIVLALVRDRQAETPVKAVLQEREPLTLTEQAMENYLYSAGFSLEGELLLDAEGKAAGSLAAVADGEGAIGQLILRFSLPTYYETEVDEDLAGLKAQHDAGAQRGEEMFLALFDAIAATDGRVAARRDSALEKLEKTMNTGKAAVQSANSWRFSFSQETGLLESNVTILFEKVK